MNYLYRKLAVAALAFASAFTATDLFANPTCVDSSTMRDTLRVTEQGRPVQLSKYSGGFALGWYGKENYSDVIWKLEFSVQKAVDTSLTIRRLRYDDDLAIYLNGSKVYSGIKNGINPIPMNLQLKQYLRDGENEITIHLLNDIPVSANMEAHFDYREQNCTVSELKRPSIPLIANSNTCTETLVCTQPKETRRFNGVDVTRDCWAFETKRTCFDFTEDKSTCSVEDSNPSKSCEVTSRRCIEEKEYEANGKKYKGCVAYENQYQCTETIDPSRMTTQQRREFDAQNEMRRNLCKPVQTCVGDDCYISQKDRDKPDTDMPMVLALLQIGQQASTYMDLENMRIFGGVVSRCRSKRGFGAMASCCEVKEPIAEDSKGNKVPPTNSNTFANSNEITNQKFDDLESSYSTDYKQGASNPYTYDALYKPNEATYMLQGTQAMMETDAGAYGMNNGGAATVTVMGYGYSSSGTAAEDQSSFVDYSKTDKKGTPND